MTTKKNKENNAISINLDAVITSLETSKEAYETKAIEIETLEAEQLEVREQLSTTAEQLQAIYPFASDEQKQRIDTLNLEAYIKQKGSAQTRSTRRGKGNETCRIAHAILEEHEGEMTNEDLHRAYIDALNNKSDALTYTQFNIAIRPLTNNDKVVKRTFVEKGNSRSALMTLTTEEA